MDVEYIGEEADRGKVALVDTSSEINIEMIYVEEPLPTPASGPSGSWNGVALVTVVYICHESHHSRSRSRDRS